VNWPQKPIITRINPQKSILHELIPKDQNHLLGELSPFYSLRRSPGGLREVSERCRSPGGLREVSKKLHWSPGGLREVPVSGRSPGGLKKAPLVSGRSPRGAAILWALEKLWPLKNRLK